MFELMFFLSLFFSSILIYLLLAIKFSSPELLSYILELAMKIVPKQIRISNQIITRLVEVIVRPFSCNNLRRGTEEDRLNSYAHFILELLLKQAASELAQTRTKCVERKFCFCVSFD